MKIIFIILLIMNVVYVIGRQLYPNDENTTRASMFNPEIIVLLPIDQKPFLIELFQRNVPVLRKNYPTPGTSHQSAIIQFSQD